MTLRDHFDGLTPFEATQEYAEATKALVESMLTAGQIPREGIPGWIAGACVTAIITALRESE